MATVIQITITTDDSGRIRFDTDAEVKDNLAKEKPDFETHADEAMDVANETEAEGPTKITIVGTVTAYADSRTIERTARDVLTPLAEENDATIDSITVDGRQVTVKGSVDSYLDPEALRREVRSILNDAIIGQPVRIESVEVSA